MVLVANLLLELYYEEDIIVVNQDECFVLSNDNKMYSWATKNEKAEIYLGEKYSFHKLSIWAVITNKGDLFYMITNAGTHECTY